MHATTFEIRDYYWRQDVEVSVTNGTERVSLGLRPVNAPVGVGGSMTPETARQLAAELNARADEVERRRNERAGL